MYGESRHDFDGEVLSVSSFGLMSEEAPAVRIGFKVINEAILI